MTGSRDTPSLSSFLASQCDATKAKYAAELEHANGEWQKPIDFRYAESLVYFGELERDTEMLYSDSGRLLGSRTRFRKAARRNTSRSAKRIANWRCPDTGSPRAKRRIQRTTNREKEGNYIDDSLA